MPPRNPSWQKRPPTTGNDWGFKHVISLKIWQSTGKESVQPSCPRGPAQLAGAIHDFIAKKTINFLDALHSWGLAGRAAAQNFFEITFFYWFLLIFSVKNLKKSKFSKISILSFFPKFLPTFVRIFNLEKIYRPNIPAGWDIFRTELYPEMDSNSNLNGWTIL